MRRDLQRDVRITLAGLVFAAVSLTWIIIDSRPVVAPAVPLEDQSVTLEYGRTKLRFGLRPQDFVGARP